MIPKIIHYCWFGGNPLPELTIKCIDSWRKFCPNYEIKEWNESNFDVNIIDYAKEAYDAKKYAFVADYARFFILHKYGGIYFDTDIEVVRPIDDVLGNKCFFGFGPHNLTLPVFGAEPQQPFYREVLLDYEKRHFIQNDGTYDLTTIERMAQRLLIERYGLQLNGKPQLLKTGVYIYPKEYFFSTDYLTGVTTLNEKLYVIHHCDGSWLDEESKLCLKYQRTAIKYLGRKVGSNLGFLFFFVKTKGFLFTVKKVVIKFVECFKRN